VLQSQSGDFFVDPATEIGWSTRPSVLMTYDEAQSYCPHIGSGWRMPTVGELQTTFSGPGQSLKPQWQEGIPEEGVLFSSEEIPVIDDQRMPYALNIADGKILSGYQGEGYVRCAHGEVTRKSKPYVQPPALRLGERWWEADGACPRDSVARGTPGLIIACKNQQGRKHGRVTTWTQSGRTDQHFRDGELDGKMVTYRMDSSVATEVSYSKGQLHGKSIQWHITGQKAVEASYANGQLHGRRTQWDQSGRKLTEASYRNGQLHGRSSKWDASGRKLTEASYRNGQLHGRSIQWYPGGKKSLEASYNSGVLDGMHTRWNERGQMLERTRYRKARIVDQQHYENGRPRNGLIEQKHADGSFSYFGLFKKGRAIGKHYGYYKSGVPRFEKNYNAKGVPNGPSIIGNPNGTTRERSVFVNGALHGERMVFDEQGRPLMQYRYDHGVLLKQERLQ
jgi:antitoxin component YwqK of YwqJK toxin-antitoxin module